MKTKMSPLFASAVAVGILAFAGGANAQTMKVGITQNNVGIDSYQTTYEKAFIEASDANPNVETVVLDAGGDVARQISQMRT